MGFSLFSSFRDPDQFCDRPPPNPFQDILETFRPPLKPFQDILETFRPPLNLFRIFLEPFRPPLNLSRIFLEAFRPPLKSFQDILDNMIFLSNSAKPTFIYLSLSVGINLVLLLSSDPLTVIVGFACLVLSLSSLASFYLDQVMLDQESI